MLQVGTNHNAIKRDVCLFVGCLTSQQQAIVYLRDGSAQTILRAATLR